MEVFAQMWTQETVLMTSFHTSNATLSVLESM